MDRWAYPRGVVPPFSNDTVKDSRDYVERGRASRVKCRVSSTHMRVVAAAAVILISLLLLKMPLIMGGTHETQRGDKECDSTEIRYCFWVQAFASLFAGAAAALLIVRAHSLHLWSASGYSCVNWARCVLGTNVMKSYFWCGVPRGDEAKGMFTAFMLLVLFTVAALCWMENMLLARVTALEDAMLQSLGVRWQQRMWRLEALTACLALIVVSACWDRSNLLDGAQDWNWGTLILITAVCLLPVVCASVFDSIAVRALFITFWLARSALSTISLEDDSSRVAAKKASNIATMQFVGTVAAACTTMACVYMLQLTFISSKWVHIPYFTVMPMQATLQAVDVVSNAIAVLALSGVLGAKDDATRSAAIVAAEAERQRRQRRAMRSSAWQGSNNADWQHKVEELAHRGFTLERLLEFYAGLGVRYMKHFDADIHTTNDVVRQSIIPLSSCEGCAYASLMMSHQATRPSRMVTHSWGNLFRDLVAAVIGDALEETTYRMIASLLSRGNIESLQSMLQQKGALQKTYWICAFSVNQHAGICGANPAQTRDPVSGHEHPVCKCGKPKYFNTDPPLQSDGRSIPCEMNKFDDMMAYLAATDPEFSQVIAVDVCFQLFGRAWCVAELAKANDMAMKQNLKLCSPDTLEKHKPMLRQLRVQDMKASRPEDIKEILASILDVEEFNSTLQELIFDESGGLLSTWKEADGVGQMALIGKLIRWQAAATRTDPVAMALWKSPSGMILLSWSTTFSLNNTIN